MRLSGGHPNRILSEQLGAVESAIVEEERSTRAQGKRHKHETFYQQKELPHDLLSVDCLFFKVTEPSSVLGLHQ